MRWTALVDFFSVAPQAGRSNRDVLHTMSGTPLIADQRKTRQADDRCRVKRREWAPTQERFS
jgi:hypothetical protein